MGFDVKNTILLIEDLYLPATQEKLYLEMHGYKVVMANSGETAIKALDAVPPIDLVLMDINLADGSDGFLVAENILKDHEIPIVFVLGHPEPEVIEKLEKDTFYGYVFKQSSVAVLESAIKMALRLFKANRKLGTSNQRLHATLDAFSGLLLEVDADGYIHDIQAHHHERLLKPTADMVGKRMQEVLSPTVAQILMDAIKEAPELTGWKLESTVVDGIVRWFELSVSRIASHQDIPRFIVISRDITRKYTSDEKVKASESRLSHAEKIAKIGNWEINLQSKAVVASSSAYKIYGLPAGELHLRDIKTIPLPEYREILDNALSDLVTKDIPYDLEFRIRRADDGRIVDIHSLATFNKSENTVMGVIQDITENKKLINSERRSHQMFADIVFSTSDWVWEVDEKYTYIYSSQKADEILGRSSEEIIGKSPFDFMEQEEAERVGRIFTEIVASRSEIKELENWIVKKNGERRCLLTNAVPVINENNVLKGYRGIDKDITESKYAEQRRERLLLEKNALIKELFHRTRNNIQVMIALFSLKGGTSKNAELTMILDEMTDRLLAMSLVQKKLYDSQDLSRVDLKAYTEEYLRTIQTKASSEWDRIKIVAKLDSVVALIDTAIPFGLVLNELVMNARIHAFPSNKPGEIKVNLHKGYENNFCLEVSDNGVGLADAFEPRKSDTVGFQLIFGLVENQMNGKALLENRNGLAFNLYFSDSGYFERVANMEEEKGLLLAHGQR